VRQHRDLIRAEHPDQQAADAVKHRVTAGDDVHVAIDVAQTVQRAHQRRRPLPSLGRYGVVQQTQLTA